MPNTFSGLNLASNALRSFQRALDTTGHNIANVNTTGYSRQAVSFVQGANDFFYSNGQRMSLGGGVTISSLQRIRDTFLDTRQRANAADSGKSGAYNNALNEVQSLFQDATGGGISSAIGGFFNAWSNLAADPTQSANRLKVQQAGQTLTDDIRNTYSQLQTVKTQQTQLVTGTITQIQGLANRISELNTQIREEQASGASPNDLLDQRDLAMLQLNQLTDATSSVFSDGTMVVNVGGFDLVDAQGANQFPTASFDPNTQTVSDGIHSYPIKGGQLAGAMQSLVTISGYMSNLDNLANTMRTQINALHQSGTNPLGNTGVDFFNDSSPQTGAADFDLSAAVRADPNAIVTSVDGTAGDGGIALALSRLQDSKQAALGTRTFGTFFNDLVTQVGSDVAGSQTALDTHNAVGQQIANQIQSVSGVSLDDEMSNMLQFQRSYQAAAKLISVFDQVTQDVINMIK